MTETSEDILAKLEASGARPDEGQLVTIARLAALQIEREGEVDRLTAALKEAKTALDDIRDKQLPDAMKAARCTKYVDDDGNMIELKDEFTISLPKVRNDEIIAQLREWGFGPLVSNTLSCEIDKGKDNMAAIIMEKAKELGLPMVRTEKVNAGSVKKVLKDKMKEGEDVDLTFFGAFNILRAKITR